MDRIELRLKMEAETKKASDNENGTRTDVSEEYVDWLERQVKNCSIPDVSQQRELLIKAFDLINIHDGDREKIAKLVDITLKSINCG